MIKNNLNEIDALIQTKEIELYNQKLTREYKKGIIKTLRLWFPMLSILLLSSFIILYINYPNEFVEDMSYIGFIYGTFLFISIILMFIWITSLLKDNTKMDIRLYNLKRKLNGKKEIKILNKIDSLKEKVIHIFSIILIFSLIIAFFIGSYFLIVGILDKSIEFKDVFKIIVDVILENGSLKDLSIFISLIGWFLIVILLLYITFYKLSTIKQRKKKIIYKEKYVELLNIDEILKNKENRL